MSILMIHILDGDLYISALDFFIVIGSGVSLIHWMKDRNLFPNRCSFHSSGMTQPN